MALYDMTRVRDDAAVSKESLIRLDRTSFAKQSIGERTHLQAAIRDHIELIDEDLYVIAEEFGDFEGVNRRIDLLCVDRACRLVVVELKRTADGGHMELQALRYAAMISTMTFAQVVSACAKYRVKRSLDDATEDAVRAELLGWLETDDEDEPVIAREVGVVLVSEDFSSEITTTVLWLNEFHDFDIRCIRLRPYELDDRLLLDVQHVIPLPESSQYMVRVREKENAVRQHKTGGSDLTKFVVRTPYVVSDPLPKRWAMIELVKGLAASGIDMEHVAELLPNSKTLCVQGTYASPEDLWAAMQEQFDRPDKNRGRWHLADPIAVGDVTWVVANNWGTGFRDFAKALVALSPTGFAVTEAPAGQDAVS